MKHRTLMIAFTIFTCNPTWAGNEQGNAGDAVAQDFVAQAYHTLEILRRSPDMMEGLTLDQLQKAINSTHVSSQEHVFYTQSPGKTVEVDALNIPTANPPTIIVNRSRWLSSSLRLENKRSLVLHEYFGILGVERNHYNVSAKLKLKAQQADLDPVLLFPLSKKEEGEKLTPGAAVASCVEKTEKFKRSFVTTYCTYHSGSRMGLAPDFGAHLYEVKVWGVGEFLIAQSPLEKLDGCQSGRSLAQLLSALDDSSASTRYFAACELGRLGASSAYGPLLQMMQTDLSAEARGMAALVLGVIGDTRSASMMIERLFVETRLADESHLDEDSPLLSNGDQMFSAVLYNFAYGIGAQGSAENFPRLLERLQFRASIEEGWEGRAAAAFAIGILTQRVSVSEALRNQIGAALVESLRTDPSLVVYNYTTYALEKVRYIGALPLVEEMLTDEAQVPGNIYQTSREALDILAQMKSPLVIEPLRRYIRERLNGDLGEYPSSINSPICTAFWNSGVRDLAELAICEKIRSSVYTD